jgi:hypothetical protein
MTVFELVKVALDELYADGQSEYGTAIDSTIIKRLAYLTESYGDLRKEGRKQVEYRDPAIRFAYVYKYVAAHGDYIVRILEDLRDEYGAAIFDDKVLRVSCIGGGPGSDIIAILKYLDEYEGDEPVQKVICYLLDREQAWADAWTELDESLGVKVALNANFQPLNVMDPNSWQSQKKFLQADLFTMSYFVSEVMSLDKEGLVTKFWGQLFEHAKVGALFLYIDNGHTCFTSYFDNLWKASGLDLIIKKDNARFIPRFSEQASEVAYYSAKFGHSPKIQSQVSYRVLRKP